MKTKSIEEFEAVFWDFDGVIMNSNEVRDQGFLEVLKDFPSEEVEQLMEFHQTNGGLSRYVKFRYFFEEIRGESITEEEILSWALKFSEIMRTLLVNNKLLIEETLNYIKKYAKKVPMHIVSGSDQEELRYLCQALEIDNYFRSIHGSPKPKTIWVGELLEQYNYNPKLCVLIGDSKNDFEAAMDNQMDFVGYNDAQIEKLSTININFL